MNGNQIELTPFNLIEKYQHSDIKEQFEGFKQRVKGFTDINENLGLKTGDIIKFVGGYDSYMEFTSEVMGFNEDGRAFVLWDCFWLDINLPERKFKKV